MQVYLTRRQDDWQARLDNDPEKVGQALTPHMAVADALNRHKPTAFASDVVNVVMRTADLRKRGA